MGGCQRDGECVNATDTLETGAHTSVAGDLVTLERNG